MQVKFHFILVLFSCKLNNIPGLPFFTKQLPNMVVKNKRDGKLKVKKWWSCHGCGTNVKFSAMRNWTSNELFIGGQRIHWLLGRILVLNFNNLCYCFSHMETTSFLLKATLLNCTASWNPWRWLRKFRLYLLTGRILFLCWGTVVTCIKRKLYSKVYRV